MDVLAYVGVIRRQWIVVIVGLVLAQALALMAVVHVTERGLEYRSPPVYAAHSTLFVTQRGFPWGRWGLSELKNGVDVPRFADPGRMEYLASLYSELASTSRAVQAQIDRQGQVPRDSYTVTPVPALDGHPLPLIEVVGISTSPAQAVSFSNRVAQGLGRYVLLNQDANDVPQASRIQLPIVTRARTAEVLQDVKFTRPILILFLGLIVTLVIAFTRDNVRRRGTPDSDEANVEKLEAPHVAAVPGQASSTHNWNPPQQTADRSSG
jgi:hypothetical protein